MSILSHPRGQQSSISDERSQRPVVCSTHWLSIIKVTTVRQLFHPQNVSDEYPANYCTWYSTVEYQKPHTDLCLHSFGGSRQSTTVIA